MMSPSFRARAAGASFSPAVGSLTLSVPESMWTTKSFQEEVGGCPSTCSFGLSTEGRGWTVRFGRASRSACGSRRKRASLQLIFRRRGLRPCPSSLGVEAEAGRLVLRCAKGG